MRNLTDDRDDDDVVRARPEGRWITENEWRGGSHHPRRDTDARRPSRTGILVASVIGIGALAAVGIYVANNASTPELNPTPATAGTEAVDPYAGTVAVPAHIGPVMGEEPSSPASDTPAGMPDSDRPSAADASEAEAESESEIGRSPSLNTPESTDTSSFGAPPRDSVDSLSDDPDVYRPATPQNTGPDRSSRDGASGTQPWQSDNPY